MKKKILSTIFFVIMITISFTTTVSQTNIIAHKIENISNFSNLDQAELPEWSIGHFWEYDMSLNFAGVLLIEVVRMETIVTDISENEYTLELNGYVNKVQIGSYDYLNLLNTLYLSGNAHINKSTLAIKEYSLNISGNLRSPKIDFYIQLKMVFDQNLDFFDFPIVTNGGDKWNIANEVDFIITGYGEMNGEELFTIDEKSLDNPINDELSVVKKEDVSVTAGIFESFLISGGLGDPYELWYSPEVGYLVKVKQNIPIFLKISVKIRFECYVELLSTNFNHPENNTPAIPQITGPSGGKPRVEYEYTVSTNDPNQEKVYFKIDWGDGDCSEWIGPFESGEEAVVKHSWNKKAEYKIRAKAMDENGFQTAWSSYTVTIPIDKTVNKLVIFQIFNKLVSYFPLLERFLKLR